MPALYVLLGLVFSFSLLLWLIDRHRHGGLSVMRRRWLRRHGVAANATVLDLASEWSGGLGSINLASVVVEVTPDSHAPFRAIVKTTAWSNELDQVEKGKVVKVRFDPSRPEKHIIIDIEPGPTLKQRRADLDKRQAALLGDKR